MFRLLRLLLFAFAFIFCPSNIYMYVRSCDVESMFSLGKSARERARFASGSRFTFFNLLFQLDSVYINVNSNCLSMYDAIKREKE